MLTYPPSAVVDDQVLEVVGGLVDELAGGAGRRPALDDSLDRDLGISSLERVELLLRLERMFGVRLPDSVMADAATPRDLSSAILRTGPATATREPVRQAEVSPTTAFPASVPTTARTLIDALRWHAERTPDRVHIHLRMDDGAEISIRYGELLAAATRMSAALRGLGVAKGDRVALMLRTERTFFEAFVAALIAGAVPVPLYPPVRASDLLAYTRRQQGILRNAEARVLLTFAEAESLAGLIRAPVPSLVTITTAERLSGGPDSAASPSVAPSDAALIQYTSGSTGDPKGVLLSHANLLANIRGIGEALDLQSDDVGVSWLPLYHDMGLIGMWLGALYFGVPAALMSPLAFLARPSRWLWSVHAHRATISAAPNFAFDLCARKIADEELAGLDLSTWRVAVNGSEAVSAETIARFTQRFAPYGFKAEAMRPAYGLAEASVALTLGSLGRPPLVDRIAREPFERRREVRSASADDPRALCFVSSGLPLRDHHVRIADGAGQPLGERREGRIEFRGPSVTSGYFRNSDATRRVMHDGWMDSGDLGYHVGSELFVTGRAKDLIIQGGRNICAEEVEAITSTVPGIRPGCVAAFGIADPATGTERLVLVAEGRTRDPHQRESLQRAVRDRLVGGIGSPPDVVVIADPHSVLKTPSGKIRRAATRDAYLAGTLGAHQSIAVQRVRLVAGAFLAWARKAADLIADVAFTGWVMVVVLVSLPVLWGYLAVKRPGLHAHWAIRRWCRFALAACGVRPRVDGLDDHAVLDSGIFVANHASYLDVVVLMAVIPVAFRFVAKRALAGYPLIGTVIRKAGYLTIEKAGFSDRLAGAEDVGRRLREGERLLIFPEGTFVRAPGLLPFRLGAFRAAVDTGRPVVPIAIAGTRRVWPDGRWLFRRGPITVTIASPLIPQGHGWPEIVRLRDSAVAVIGQKCGEALTQAPLLPVM